MNDTVNEMSVAEMKKHIADCYLAAGAVSIEASEFRAVIMQSGTAQMIVQYDKLTSRFDSFRDVLKGTINSKEFNSKRNDTFPVLVGAAVIIVPWCYGIYKFFS